MTKKSIIAGLAGTITVVIVLNGIIRIQSSVVHDVAEKIDKLSISNTIELLEFNNGYNQKQNLQHYWDVLTDLERAEFTDPLLRDYAKGYIHFSLWQLYSSLEKMVHSFQHDLYVKPENELSFPSMPITPTITPTVAAKNNFNLEVQYQLFKKNDPVYHPHHRIIIEKIGELTSGDENEEYRTVDFSADNQSDLINKKGFLENDSIVFMINPDLISALAKYHAKESIKYNNTFISSNNEYPEFMLKARLKLIYLYGATGNNGDLNKLIKNWINFNSILADSINGYKYCVDITQALPFLLSNGLLANEEIDDIILNNSFPYIGLLNELTKASWGYTANLPTPRKLINIARQDFSEYDDQLLTPLFVLNLAEYFHRNNQFNEATELIVGFWYNDALSHPPEYWWFENYPDFVVRSYTIGRWDGGRLVLWANDFHKMAGNDPFLLLQYELLEFYNLVIFRMLSNPVKS